MDQARREDRAFRPARQSLGQRPGIEQRSRPHPPPSRQQSSSSVNEPPVPDRSYEQDRSRDSSNRSRDPRSPNSHGGHSSFNPPKGPASDRFRESPRGAASKKRALAHKPPALSTPSSRRAEPNWGGEDSLLTPASPTTAAQITKSAIESRELDQSEAATSAMGLDQDTLRRPTPTAQIGSGQGNATWPTRPNATARISPELDPARLPTHPTTFEALVAPAESDNAHMSGTTQAVGVTSSSDPPLHSLLYEKWSHHQTERDLALVALVFCKIQEGELGAKLKQLDENQRHALAKTPSNKAEVEGRFEASRKKSRDKLAANQETKEAQKARRVQNSDELAKLFALAITAVKSEDGTSSSSGGVQTLNQAPGSGPTGPTHDDFTALRKEMEELRRSQHERFVPDTNPTATDVIALKNDLDKMRRALEQSQHELADLRMKLKQPATEDLKTSSEDIDKLKEQVKSAGVIAKAAKNNAVTTWDKLLPRMEKLEERLDEVTSQLEAKTTQEPDDALREQLRRDLITELDPQTMRLNLSQLREDILALKRELSQAQTVITTQSSLPGQIQDLSQTMKKYETRFDELVKANDNLKLQVAGYAQGLDAAKASIQGLKNAFEAQPSEVVADNVPGSTSAAAIPSQPGSGWGSTQHVPTSSSGSNIDVNRVQGQLQRLEIWLQALSARMNNESMQPQFKAILTSMAQQIPHAPRLLQELSEIRAQRHDLSTLVDGHKTQLVAVEQHLQGIRTWIGKVEEKVDEGSGNLTEGVKSCVDALKADLQSVVQSLDTGVKEDLHAMEIRLRSYEVIFEEKSTDLDIPLCQLRRAWANGHVETKQSSLDETTISNKIEAVVANRALPDRRNSSRTSVVPLSTVAGTARATSKANSAPSKARTFSERERGSSDEEEGEMIKVAPRSKQLPEATSASTIDNGRSAGMRQVLLKKRRQHGPGSRP